MECLKKEKARMIRELKPDTIGINAAGALGYKKRKRKIESEHLSTLSAKCFFYIDSVFLNKL